MHTIGEQLTFTATATGTGLVYVWEWWDGTTSVSVSNVATKVANRSGTLLWKVTVVDPLGRSAIQSGTVDVVKPPEFSNVTLTSNDAIFSYPTALSATVVSPNFPVTVRFNGSTSIVAAGTGVVNFAMLVTTPQTLFLAGTDTNGSVSKLPIELRGVSNRAPVVTAPQVSPAVFRVGAGLSGQISVTASDPEGTAVTFEWVLTIGNGWAANQTLFGTTTPFGTSYQNVLSLPTVGQTAGAKTVVLNVKDTSLATTTLTIPVVLVANQVPVISSILAFPGNVVGAGTSVVFTGSVTDADNDPLTYMWSITGPIVGGSVSRFGFVTSVDTVSAGTVNSNLSVTDGVGGAAAAAGSPVVVN